MVGALPVVCCQVAASQAAAAGQSCHTTRLSDVHPHRRSTPFSTLNKPTGFAYCRTNKRSTTTCACNHIPSKQAQARRTDWQLEATRNTKQDKNTKQVEDEKVRKLLR